MYAAIEDPRISRPPEPGPAEHLNEALERCQRHLANLQERVNLLRDYADEERVTWSFAELYQKVANDLEEIVAFLDGEER